MKLTIVIHQLFWNVLILQFPKFIDILNFARPYTPFGRTIAHDIGLGPSHSPRMWLVWHPAWAQFGVIALFLKCVIDSCNNLTEKKKIGYDYHAKGCLYLSFLMLVQMILLNPGVLGNNSLPVALVESICYYHWMCGIG